MRAANPKLLRERAAAQFVSSIENPITKQLVEAPYREALRRFAERASLPVSDFDIAFFVEGLFRSLSCHDRVQAYLDGADHRWFPEDDDEIRDALFCPLQEKALPLEVDFKFRFPKGPGPFAFCLDSLVRRHEASWLIHSEEDIAITQIIGVAVAAIGRHYYSVRFPGEPKLPAGCPFAPFDILFCAQILLKTLSDKDWLRSTLALRGQ
jgi:hypothetical protein